MVQKVFKSSRKFLTDENLKRKSKIESNIINPELIVGIELVNSYQQLETVFFVNPVHVSSLEMPARYSC